MFKYCPNIYTGSLDGRNVNAAINHAKEEFPNESCGIISEGKYIKFKNESETPEESFEIKDDLYYELYINEKVECIVHSHNDSNRASKMDQIQQKEIDVPFLIINLRNRSLMDCIVFGEKEPAPLEGRPFFWGALDCTTLAADWVKQIYDFQIEYPPHDFYFCIKQVDLFETYLREDTPFYEVDIKDKKPGDILLYNIDGSRFINHIAVYLSDNGEVLHHMYNNISGRYPFNFNRKYLRKVMRFDNDNSIR